jgi:hypothetical protein
MNYDRVSIAMRVTDYPLVAFFIILFVLWISAKGGAHFAHRVDDVRDDFKTVTAATLTLLGLIVGFTFSMAVGRYDQRKHLEEEEANAISTEHVRAELLPASDAETVRRLLQQYLDQRISFYRTRDRDTLQRIDAATLQQHSKLWESVKGPSLANPTPLTALVVSGMNDVLNSQGYTQAAWSNRIPPSAWTLLALISICSNAMVGMSLRSARSRNSLIVILPLIVSVSLLLISDIDSARSGLIHVEPENLLGLKESLRTGGVSSTGR